MYQVHSLRWKPLLISLAISLGVGGLSAILTMQNVKIYQSLNQPPLSPPAFIFGIVWTILFILMGISAYLIYTSDSPDKRKALVIYGIQLLLNFGWSLIFFNVQAYLLAFIWLIVLWIFIILMIISFYRINPTAAILQIPYLLWVTFAAYLNLGIYLLNK